MKKHLKRHYARLAYYEEKTLDNLAEGDILINDDGYECEVLGVCGRGILMSEDGDFNTADGVFTKEQLIRDGYKIKGASEKNSDIDDVIKLLEEMQELETVDKNQMLKVIKMLREVE